MRPICGCPENVRESLASVTDTFPEIINGLLLLSTVVKCVQNLTFVALHAPKTAGGTVKNLAVPRYAHAPFCLKL